MYEVDGTGVAVGTQQFQFNADPDDVVTMCDNVWTSTRGHEKDCSDATTSSIIPEPVAQLIDDVKWLIDDVTCEQVAWQAGGPADQPPAFDIRSDGDLYVDFQLVWDCPPYDSSGW